MVQEDIDGKVINLAITTGKLSIKSLISGLRIFVEYKRNKDKGQDDHRIKGKQTVKQLVGQNQGVTSIPVTDGRIVEFDRIAKKYGVDYAVIKNGGDTEAKYTIFFKSRDSDVLEEIIRDYTNIKVQRRKIPAPERKPENEVIKQAVPVIKPETRERSR